MILNKLSENSHSNVSINDVDLGLNSSKHCQKQAVSLNHQFGNFRKTWKPNRTSDQVDPVCKYKTKHPVRL